MLQQTQATAVIPYFKKWMDCFPNIEALAAASLDEVLKIWEGLGYYSRARRLHEAAKYLMKKHQGMLPQETDLLKEIPGLGPYTVGAILSFAFHQKAPAVDGNVTRVITRFFQIEGNIEKSSVKKEIFDRVMEILPDENPWVAMEALIELGALICGRRPNCLQCPLKEGCQAYKEGKMELYPKKVPPPKITQLIRAVAIVKYKDQLLIERSTSEKLMSHLCQFPFVELQEINFSLQEVSGLLEEKTGCRLKHLATLDQVEHSFTRYRAQLLPFIFETKTAIEKEPYRWIDITTLTHLPFAAGHRIILKMAIANDLDYEKNSAH